MLFNMVLPGAVATEEPFTFEYSGNFTDNRDADGKGTVRLNTSGTLTVLSGKATVSVYILGGGGGGAQYSRDDDLSESGGGGGYQTVEVELTPGTYEIVIGTGGAGKYGLSYPVGTGETGGTTTAFGYTSTGGTGGANEWSTQAPGKGGTPNGGNGSTGLTAGGSPNGGASNGGSASANSGGDGYVELTFI